MSARLTAAVVPIGLALSLGVVLAAAACEPRQPAPTEPVWNKQPCAWCAMLVSEPRTAAELQTTDGDHLFFDDPGCLVEYLHARRPHVAGMWMRLGDAWVDARAARFESGRMTPMGYGFLASADGTRPFADLERAVSAARDRR